MYVSVCLYECSFRFMHICVYVVVCLCIFVCVYEWFFQQNCIDIFVLAYKCKRIPSTHVCTWQCISKNGCMYSSVWLDASLNCCRYIHVWKFQYPPVLLVK